MIAEGSVKVKTVGAADSDLQFVFSPTVGHNFPIVNAASKSRTSRY